MPGLHTCHFHASYDGYTLEIFPIAIDMRPGGSLSASMSRSSSATKWSSRGSDAEGAQRLLATVGWTARSSFCSLPFADDVAVPPNRTPRTARCLLSDVAVR